MKQRVLKALQLFVLVVLLLQGGIALGVAFAWEYYATPELVFDVFMPEEHLSFYGREGVELAANDLRRDLTVMWAWVYVVAAAPCLAWILCSRLWWKVRTPEEVYEYRIWWWSGLAFGAVALLLAAYLNVIEHPDLTTLARWVVSAASLTGYLLLFWIFGTLWATPPVLTPVVPLASRLVRT